MTDILGLFVVIGAVVVCIIDMVQMGRQDQKDEDKKND